MKSRHPSRPSRPLQIVSGELSKVLLLEYWSERRLMWDSPQAVDYIWSVLVSQNSSSDSEPVDRSADL